VAGCDSIATLNLNINDVLTSTTDITICSNQVPYSWNGVDYNAAGTYTANLLTVAGCDSIATLNLSINDVLTSTTDVTICSNQFPYNWNGVDYNAAGTYTANLLSITGCDSIATLNLAINDVLTSTTDITICSNQIPYNWNGVDYNAAGTYTANLLTVAGCDSIATLNLNINDVLTSTTDITICSNQIPYNWNGVDYSVAGTYTANLLSITGCDSIATLNLNINDVLTSTTDVTICSNQIPYNWNGVDYSAAGTYTANLLTVAGCDSIATLNLNISPSYFTTESITINEGQSYTLPNGSVVTTTGTYTSNLITSLGCDSVITSNVTVLGAINVVVNASICEGEFYTLPDGSTVAGSGSYAVTLQAASGADSTITTILTEYPVYSIQLNEAICQGESWTLPDGGVVAVSGVYTTNLTSIFGCDSTIITNLIVNPLPTAAILNNTGTNTLTCSVPSISLTASGGGTYFWSNGLGSNPSVTITAPGTYFVTVTLPSGCSVSQSITILEDNVSPILTLSTSNNQTQLTCDVLSIDITANGSGSIIWSNGLGIATTVSVTSPGVYSATLTAANGCVAQGSVTITQDVTPPIVTITNITGTNTLTCDITNITLSTSGIGTYLWTPNSNTNPTIGVNTPGEYSVTVTGPNGCSASDSYTVLQDIIPPVAGLTNLTGDSVLTCDLLAIDLIASGGQGYVWTNGAGNSPSLTVTAPGVYTVIAVGQNGCTDQESIAVYQDINEPTPTIVNVEFCEGDSYQLPNDQSVFESGTYNVVLNAYNGCDSLVVTNVTVHPNEESFFAVRICPGEIYTLPNGQSVSEAGNYPVMFESIHGCDSLVTFIIDIIQTFNIVQNVVICPGESYQLPDGTNQTSEGAFEFNYVSSFGCDSVVTYFLDIYNPIVTTIPVTLCNGESYVLPTGQTVITAGNYPQILQSISGCDSTVITQVSVLPALQSFVNNTICQGTQYILPNGQSVSQSGIYSNTITSINGCDSTVVTTLNIQPSIIVALVPFADTVNVCLGDSVLLNAVGANTYNWSPNEYLTPLSTATAEAEPPISMWYYVTGNSGPCSANDSLYIQVVPLPDLAITSSELTICQGDSALISASGAEYFTWSPPLNDDCVTCNNAFAAPNSSTTYTLQGYANGCYNSTSFTLEVMQAALASVNGDTVVCENSPLLLSASGGNSYLWNTGETTSSIEVYPLNDTTYSVVVTLGNCVDSAFFDIYVAPFENVYAGEDTLITLGSSVILNASGADQYSWSPTGSLSCGYCSTPTATPIETTEYCVTGTDLWGCNTEDCVRIEVTIECETFFAPNVFAPAEGGHIENDCYRIYGTECFDTFKLSIYNRWGEVVFETENKEDCWDGTYRGQDVNSGVFVYQLDGVLVTGQEFSRKGNITLVR
jgi:gliding motility-associated-like protein